MKTGILLIFACLAITSCASTTSVKTDADHGKLIGFWVVKANSYVVRFDDEPSRNLIVPCDFDNRTYLPSETRQFDESAFGYASDGMNIVGGIRQGQVIQITDVFKEIHPTMGTRYRPLAFLVAGSLPANLKLDARILYEGLERKGILNPQYAERVGGQY